MKKFNLRYSSVALSIVAMSAFAATTNTYAQSSETEEIVVTGTRQVIQDAIEQKRISTEIVDGLSADEIGDIPALSIGEALETITGASSNRENGGASEVSIRGLGPFLTNTVINGREATNGAGNRAVNFSIFPSELFNKIGIFKTQSASFIEGAVAGQIRLETKRPIEHGKQSIQVNLKAAYNEGEQDVNGGDDIGYRGTISYIDQFETEKYGTFGISLGAQIRDETNPEQEFTRSNTPRVCDLDNDTGFASSQTCADDQDFLRGAVTNEAGEFATDLDRESFAFLSSSAQFRQNRTEDERNSFFGGFQWQPNEKLDLNLDVQLSERIQDELRSDLVFAELNRNLDVDGGADSADSVVFEDNILQSFTNAGQEIQLISQDFTRDEQYQAVGFNLDYQASDILKLSFDASYSNTERVESEESLRLADEVERLVSADFTGSNDVGVFGVTQLDGSAFDAGDLGEFLSGATESGEGSTAAEIEQALIDSGLNADDRIRFRSQEDIRENTITSLRGDFELLTEDLGFITSIEGGVRFSELEFERRGNLNTDFNLDALTDQFGTAEAAEILASIANNCIDSAIDDDFEEVSSDQNDEFLDFNSIDAGCSFGILRTAFDTLGLDASELLDPTEDFNSGSIDVEESTFAAYLQANYESTLFGLPARGNFGLRLVNTSVDSRTFRSGFQIDDNGDSFELDSASQANVDAFIADNNVDFNTEVNDDFSYTELLPSATLVLDLTDQVIFRTGIFRGLSRADPAILGTRQQVGTVETNIVDGAGVTTEDVQSFVSGQTTTGGAADLQAFTSWNIDAALEWYPNKDTILAAGVYYKKFRGGFENTVVQDDFLVINTGAGGELVGDNGVVTANVSGLQTTNESSNLYGIELTASHAFSYLPGFLGGFGAKLSYNYASSDFEFEDDFAGEGVGLSETGEPIDLIGLIPSADIFGLSRNVASGQIYWSGGPVDAQVIVKHRSQYFQQFVDTPGRIRFVDDNTVVEFRASYKLNDNIRLSFEALNLTDEPRTDFRGLEDNVAQVLSFGPRYFFGIRAKI